MGLTFFLPFLGSGPFWKETVDPIVEGCEKNWWVNLVYMQTYINTNQMVS